MERSEIQKATINLGKLLVKELNLESTSDTLGRWMAHYISGKIRLAEVAKGKAKAAAEDECAQLIIDLWAHRWQTQGRYNPLKNFGQLFDMLSKIDPEEDSPYYYERAPVRNKDVENNEWLEAAYDVDKAARVCLKFMLQRAADSLKSNGTEVTVMMAHQISPDADMEVIKSLLNLKDYDFDPDAATFKDDDFSKDFDKASVNNQIAYLDKLIKQAKGIKSMLKKELQTQGSKQDQQKHNGH